MEVYILVADEPLVVLGLVRVQVVKDDVEFLFRRVLRYDTVHEVKELPAATAVVVPRSNHSRCDFQRCKQGRGPMPLVVVAEPG